jgi:two-component sensor histidine kinase
VVDDGRGLPSDFDPDTSGNLGLQIVRTLVVGELGGQLELARRESGGTAATLDIPLKHEHDADHESRRRGRS